MAIRERTVRKIREKDGTVGEIIIQEDDGLGDGAKVDLSALDEARTVAEGDADLAELQELLGVGKADAVRRAVRFTLAQKKSQGGK